MVRFIKNLAISLGIDKSIAYTSLARMVQSFGGIVSVLFVARYLTIAEQGFYYTFGSIVAIQIFFELGLNGIITQYVAHETANLTWESPTQLNGASHYQSRLSSLLHFSIKWYGLFACILFLVLSVAGFLFFKTYSIRDAGISWKIPWVLLATGTALNLLLTPVFAFFEGLGMVKEVAKMRLNQQCLSLIILWVGLLGGLKLYVLGINSLFIFTFLSFLILKSRFKTIFLNIFKITIVEKVDYRREIFPYQWKIALSWISGYFIFQLFNPVLFATEGAAVAGQMGMTLAVLNGIQALSLSWMTTKVPLYSGLIAQKQYHKLDAVFNRTLIQSVTINGGLLVIMFLGIYTIRHFQLVIGGMNLGNRFLAYLPLLFMIIPLFLNQFISSWALYLRCHKKEPYLITSITGGILCCVSTLVGGKIWGVMGVTLGYCIITLFLFIWSLKIYNTKKKEWHEE